MDILKFVIHSKYIQTNLMTQTRTRTGLHVHTRNVCVSIKSFCPCTVRVQMRNAGFILWHDLRAGRSLQATFDNTIIQLCPALSLQLGRPWIITLAILSMGGKRSYTPFSQTTVKGKKKKKKNSVGTAAGQDWEDFEGQNLRITH